MLNLRDYVSKVMQSPAAAARESDNERRRLEKAERDRAHKAKLAEFDEWCASTGQTREQGMKTFAYKLNGPMLQAQDIATKQKAANDRTASFTLLASERELGFADLDAAVQRQRNALVLSEIENRTATPEEQHEFDAGRVDELRARNAIERVESAMLKAGLTIPARAIGPLTTRSSGLAAIVTNDDVIDDAAAPTMQPRSSRRDASELVAVADVPNDRARRDLEKAGVSHMRRVTVDGKTMLEPIAGEHDLVRTVS